MICSDGGITCPGDICKAFGAGTDFIMIGGLFAGTDEAEGEIIEKFVTNGEYDMIPIDDTGYTFEQLLTLAKTRKEIMDFLKEIDVLVVQLWHRINSRVE